MRVAVIILNYNSSTDCRKCISFLKKQQGVDIEIVVVDNCSSDDDLNKLRILCKDEQCTLIENHENRGYNAGNNIGLRYAAGKGYKYALIANPDMEFPQTNYLRYIVESMEKMPDVVVIGTDIVGVNGEHQNPMPPDGNWRQAFSWIKTFLSPQHIYDFDNKVHSQESHYCNKVCGCCLLVCMDFICNIGYFDENIFLYCEEAILAKQVEAANRSMYYIANIKAVHRHIKSTKGDPVTRFKHWEHSRIYFEQIYNYQGRWDHYLKLMGWKIYKFIFILKKRFNH